MIIKSAKGDDDYVFTLKKYWGKPGFYMGLVGPTILIWGAITTYFVVIVQSLYPLLYVLIKEGLNIDIGPYIKPTDAPYCRFDAFSASYVAVLMYVVLVAINMKKDLSIFMRMGSLGAFCVTVMIIFVVSYFVYSMTNSNYKVFMTPNDAQPKSPVNDFHYLYMVNPETFSNLAALLCVGYYMH